MSVMINIPEQNQLSIHGENSDNNDTLIAPLAIVGFVVSHPYIAAGTVATVGFVVSVAIKYIEKAKRDYLNLPVQPWIDAIPFINPETRKSEMKFTISGTYPDRRILLKMGKGLYYGLFDTVIADRIGDGDITLDGGLLLDLAKKNNVIDIGLPVLTPGVKRIWIYAQESRPWMGDIRSPITPIEIKVDTIFELIKEEAQDEFDAITPEEAVKRSLEGKISYLKIWLPILSIIPGVPYTPGMWIPWGFIITTKP